MAFSRLPSFFRLASFLRPPMIVITSIRPDPVRHVARPLSTTPTVSHGERHNEHKKDKPDFEVEKHKMESLEKQKKGQGQWSSELASDSEEAIQADKSSFDVKDVGKKGK